MTVVPAGSRYSSSGARLGPAPLMEQLGHGVGGRAGFVGQDAGRLGRRRDAEHRSPPGVQVVHGTPERGRFAGAGWPDDQHQLVATGDRRRSLGLQDVLARPDRGEVDGSGPSTWASMAQASTCSSSARIAYWSGARRWARSTPNAHPTPSAGRARPAGRGLRSGRSPGRTPPRAHPTPPASDTEDTGGWRSQIARVRSARVDVEPAVESWSITASIVVGTSGVRSRLAASISAVNRPAVHHSAAASPVQRVRRSVTPLPVLCARVSVAASRVSAARSHRVGSRPSRAPGTHRSSPPVRPRFGWLASRTLRPVRGERRRSQPDH